MKPIRSLAFSLSLAAVGAAAARPGAEGSVAVRDGAFEIEGRPVAFACADGVPLPEAGAEDALAEKLAACGFDLVRLPDVSAPADVERLDAFSAACARRGLRLWADALVPALAVPPDPADVAAIDDPFSAAAWTNALAEAERNGFDPFLAAPWDPRLELLLQRRVRDWARAFNPAAGLRRNDDPAWALVGFSSGWRNAFLFTAAATNAPVPPAFFRDGFSAVWNAWLYNRYGSDEAAAAVLRPGESVVSNAVAWIGSPFGPPPAPDDPPARLRDEKIFLQSLYLAHVRRVAIYFRETGGHAATVPVFARWGEGAGSLLPAVSDVRFAGGADGTGPTIAFFPAGGGAAEATAAADALVFPCGGAPEPFAPWARLFHARAAAGATARADAADAAVLAATFGADGPAGNPIRFEKTGVSLRLLRAGGADEADSRPAAPPAGGGLSVDVLLPAGAGAVRLEFAFAPDSPGAAMNLFARVRSAETGADLPFGLAVAGSPLRKREWRDLSPGAAPGKRDLPPGRILRLPAAAGPRLLLFPPETFESDLLKRIEAGS